MKRSSLAARGLRLPGEAGPSGKRDRTTQFETASGKTETASTRRPKGLRGALDLPRQALVSQEWRSAYLAKVSLTSPSLGEVGFWRST